MSRFSRLYNTMAGHLIRAFGDAVTYIPRVGSAYELAVTDGTGGIFEAVTQLVDPDTGAVTLSNQPNIYFRLADLKAEPQNGDRIKVNGITYKILEPQYDGQGGVTIRLQK